jgi:hypothetical protein
MSNRKARFKVGDTVFVRDKAAPKGGTHYREDGSYIDQRGGYRIVKAVVQDVHFHPGREPFYPHGEGYSFNGCGASLWWDCYPGCRVWATREEAIAARMTEEWVMQHFYAENKS